MQTSIINQPLTLHLSGFSGIVSSKQYAEMGFKLMDKLWKTIREHNISNKGKNIWLYEPGEKLLAAVELTEALPEQQQLFEVRELTLNRYAYHKHIGPYSLIQQAGKQMITELTANGTAPGNTYIEIYGHWDEDASKLETELIMSL